MRRAYEWIADHPYRVIGLILCITVVFLAFIPRLAIDTDFSHYIDQNDPALVATRRAEDRYGAQSLLILVSTMYLVFFGCETEIVYPRLVRSQYKVTIWLLLSIPILSVLKLDRYDGMRLLLILFWLTILPFASRIVA